MNHRAVARSQQDLTLRHSLAGSSMTALTLVVAAFLALQLFAPGSLRVIDAPEILRFPPPERGGVDYTPPTSPAAPAADFTVAAAIIPADDELRAVEVPVLPALPLSDAPWIGPTDGSVTGDGRTGLPGTGTRIEVIPPPTEYVPHDEIPVVVRRVIPEYPPMARGAGFEGTVRVRAFVGVDGRVRRAETEGSPSLFDDAAVNAVRQWVFAPATSNGHPVAVWVRVPVIFRLH